MILANWPRRASEEPHSSTAPNRLVEAYFLSWSVSMSSDAPYWRPPSRALSMVFQTYCLEARLWIVSVGRPSGSYLVDSHPKETRAIMRRSNLHSRDRPGLYSSARWQLQFEAWFTSPSLKTAVLG